MGWGGARPGAGRKKQNPDHRPRKVAEVKVPSRVTVAAEPKQLPAIDPRVWAMMLPEIEEMSRKYGHHQERTAQNNPFRLPDFPKPLLEQLEKHKLPTMAMDNALAGNLNFAGDQWLNGGGFFGLPGEGLLFLGYTYLSELAQRPEFRVMSETIADDATRKWIDFDVVGDAREQEEEKLKDPVGFQEKQDDPDEKEKRLKAAGKLDKVKALKDDQLRLGVKDRFYEMFRGDGFFGRMHLFLDIRTRNPDSDEIDQEELKQPIGDGLSELSKTKCPKGAFKGLRSIEPVWTYPLMYNAVNPLRKDWYNPQTWFVMGQELHGSRCLTFIGHPVPDMLKPAYSFGGLSLTQLAKPYVDIWLQTRQSVAQLIHSFSVMVLMTDLSTLTAPGNVAALMARVAAFNMLRDNQGTYVVNKNTEDFKNVSASLSGLHELQAQSQEHMASVHRIPLVKFTGIQPAGLNASSEGEIETYDDTIAALQSRFADPHLRTIINFQQLSLFGEVDHEITHRWEKLRDMTLAEKGQKEKDDADRNQKYVDMGAISPGEVRKVIVEDPELPYTGLNPEDVPDLAQEEEEGLEPQGGRPDPKAAGEPDDKGAQDSAAVRLPKADVAYGAGSKTEHCGICRRFLVPDGCQRVEGPISSAGWCDLFAGKIQALDAAWREEDHPRAPDGKFGSGGGGGSSPQMGEVDPGEKTPQMGEGSTGSGTGKIKQQAQASALLKSKPLSPEEMKAESDRIVAAFPGGAEAIAKTRERLKGVVPSDAPVAEGGFRVDLPDGGYTYTPERLAVHKAIVDSIFTDEAVLAAMPKEGETPVVKFLGGRGGSGKSWITSKGPLAGDTSIVLDADHIKSMLPGYEGWKASAFHEESSDVLKMVDQRALDLGVNVILDATMKTESSVAMRMALYEGRGYEVEGYYMHLPPAEAATRAMSRYAKGGKFDGRFVPPEIILGNVNNEKNFDKLSGGFRKWAVYENSGKEPKLVESSH